MAQKKALIICNVKGGTGKTLVAVNIAHRMAVTNPNMPIALIDADLDNSNFSQFTGSNSTIELSSDQQFKPYKWDNIEVFSMSLIGSRSQSVSMEASRYVQILDDVIERSLWNAENFIIDMPGGSSDIFRTGVEIVADYLAGSIIVTQPSMIDATRKSLNLHEYFEIPVLGLIENMSYLQIGKKIFHPFGKSNIDEIAKEYGAKVLGKIPLSLDIAENISKGNPILSEELLPPIDNAITEFKAANIQVPGFWARMKEKVSETLQGEIEKVLVNVIVTVNKAIPVNALRTTTGFREGKPFLLVITDESATKEITSVPLRVVEDGLKVLKDPNSVEFQISTDFKTLARMIMGQRKNKDGSIETYRPEDAWYHGDLKAYGLGYTQYAVRAFRTIFADEQTMFDIRNRFGSLLNMWI